MAEQAQPKPPTAPGAPATPPAPAPTAVSLNAKPEHYVKGSLTRAGMEHVIRTGGSVLLQGHPHPITNVADLPSEAELAKGDTVAEDAARENINRQRSALDAQEALLSKPKK